MFSQTYFAIHNGWYCGVTDDYETVVKWTQHYPRPKFTVHDTFQEARHVAFKGCLPCQRIVCWRIELFDAMFDSRTNLVMEMFQNNREKAKQVFEQQTGISKIKSEPWSCIPDPFATFSSLSTQEEFTTIRSSGSNTSTIEVDNIAWPPPAFQNHILSTVRHLLFRPFKKKQKSVKLEKTEWDADSQTTFVYFTSENKEWVRIIPREWAASTPLRQQIASIAVAVDFCKQFEQSTTLLLLPAYGPILTRLDQYSQNKKVDHLDLVERIPTHLKWIITLQIIA